jgi:iron complex outermembrane recepter protein
MFRQSLFLAPAVLLGALPPSAVTGASRSGTAELALTLDPVVVTTVHVRHPLRVEFDAKAPAQPVPAQDGADVLKPIAGFAVIRKGGTDGDPVFRGMAGSRLAIEIDGEALLGGCGNRMDPPTAYVYPAAFDRVTIIKGPQTVRHGPGTAAGVVAFERDLVRLAAPATSLHATSTAGSFGRRDAAVDARSGTPSHQLRLAGTYSRSDDAVDGDGRELHSRFRRWSVNAAAAWTPKDDAVIELTAARSDGEAAYADRAMDGVAFDRDNLGARFRRSGISPLIRSVEAQIYRNAVDHVMDNFSLRPFVPTAMMPGRSVSNPDRLTEGGRAQAELKPGGSMRLHVGVDHQQNRHSIRSTSDELAAPYAAMPRRRDAEFRQTGAFVEAVVPWGAADGHRMVAGARGDDWTAVDHRVAVAAGRMNFVPNPTAGVRREKVLPSGFVRYEHELQWSQLPQPLTWYAGVGHVQRFPDYWELFSKESRTTVSAFETVPEETTQLDVGWLYRGEVLELSVALFASWIDNYILIENGVRKPAAGGMTRTAIISRNIAAETWGGEATLAWRLAPDWKVDASVASVRGDNETDGRPLAQLPPIDGRLSLQYTRSTWSAAGLLRLVAAQNRVAIGQGNIVGQDLGRSPGFAVVSFNASWRPTASLRCSAGVDNLFDRTYAEHISRAGAAVAGFVTTTRVNEPGRFFWLKVDFSR